jgi:cell division protein FtsB
VKLLTVILMLLTGLIQYPLWLGKGGWFRVWEVDRQIATQRETNTKLQARNNALDAEVRSLKQGYELGLIKQDEIFFQFSNPMPR